MRVSTSWIKSALCRTISDTEIVSALELAGIEVEQYSCSNAIDDNIIIAKVQNVRQHPEADRLHIALVSTGTEEFEVVCGATNVRAGILVPFAQVGSVLPSGDVISKAKLRGIVSNGMLCSGREIGLSDDHEGLLELSADNTIGTPISHLYPADGHLDLKTQANRFDLLSVIGLAREVAAQLDIELKSYTQTELLYCLYGCFSFALSDC
jgi:phenylalanyl-tRNA synthetase beta chain